MPKQQKLYIGNLPYRTTTNDLRTLFEKYEPIHSVVIVADKNTNRPLGYGFVELEEPNAQSAVDDMEDAYFKGRYIRVRNAKKQKADGDGPRSGGGRGDTAKKHGGGATGKHGNGATKKRGGKA